MLEKTFVTGTSGCDPLNELVAFDYEPGLGQRPDNAIGCANTQSQSKSSVVPCVRETSRGVCGEKVLNRQTDRNGKSLQSNGKVGDTY
jgi:hypothetical protein